MSPAPLILVVDDFASVQYYHELLLKKAGYRTLSARNGAEALIRLRAEPVDLLMLDLVMPVHSGPALLEDLADEPGCATLPVLVVTTEPQPLRLNWPRYRLLQKPVGTDALLAGIRELLT